MEHVSTIMHCAASSNLTLTEETLLEVLLHLSQNLNALLQQLSMTVSARLWYGFLQISSRVSFSSSTVSEFQFLRWHAKSNSCWHLDDSESAGRGFHQIVVPGETEASAVYADSGISHVSQSQRVQLPNLSATVRPSLTFDLFSALSWPLTWPLTSALLCFQCVRTQWPHVLDVNTRTTGCLSVFYLLIPEPEECFRYIFSVFIQRAVE